MKNKQEMQVALTRWAGSSTRERRLQFFFMFYMVFMVKILTT